ncbi:collectrin isoform X2 [Pogoniulus pusillus]|uniref:collectrin isoform X2 n=1 Tax=Pogoniulus pusillus TaxID=488313 RepID=UPI0030B99B70
MLWAVLLTVSVIASAHAELCKPDAQNAFKVRLSIKTALGENAYAWDAHEEYLFRAMVAFAMRRYSSKSTTQISNVLLCNVTGRVSFWFVVTEPSQNLTTVPGREVEAAIRLTRHRINSAFLLSDKTLQFLKITSTLSPPVEPSTPVWLIVFGVVLCLVVAGIVFLIVGGIRQRKRTQQPGRAEAEEKAGTAAALENGIACEALGGKGHLNGGFAGDEERFTPL